MMTKKYIKEHKEEIRAYHKQYHLKYKEKHNLRSKLYRESHQEEYKLYKAIWRKKNQKRLKEKDQKYYQSHKEKISFYQNQWRKKNKDYLKKYFKEYHHSNKKEILIKNRAYWKTNREEVLEKHRLWRKTPKGKLCDKVYRINRRAKSKGLTIALIQLVYEDNIKRYGTLTCYLCLLPIPFGKDHLEHKTPLSRGGNNKYRNLAVACETCNCKKNRKTEVEYRKEINVKLS